MCPGAAQYMFRGASSFNQPLAAWDVSQVTSMKVRRQGHNHRAPPHTAAQGSGHKPCACAGAAQDMFYSASSFNQPLAAWDVGQVKAMSVRRRPASTGWGLLLHTQLLRGTATSRVRMLARRSLCSTTRALSTSPWMHGSSARSTPCGCAARVRVRGSGARTAVQGGGATSLVCVLVWRS